MRTLVAVFTPLAAALIGCSDATSSLTGGLVEITIEQALTSQTTSAGTFQMSGSVVDAGSTIEELTFGGPLDRSPVPVTFVRTLTGRQGTLTLRGSARISFASPTVGTLDGEWTVEAATGQYSSMRGTGTLSGRADFGTTPPSASLAYSGSVKK